MAGTVRAGGLSGEIVAKLQGEVLAASATPRCGSGSRSRAGTRRQHAAEFALFVQAEIRKYAEMVRAAGIRPE